MTLHNLTFVSGLMADLRAAIAAGRLAEVADALRGALRPLQRCASSSCLLVSQDARRGACRARSALGAAREGAAAAR